MRSWLYSKQDPETGSWDRLYTHAHCHTGPTAMAVLALLVSGDSYQRPELRRAIGHLKAHQSRSTYEASLRAHVWAQLPDEFRPQLQQEAQWLARAARDDATFGYDDQNKGWDHSNTHYGLLGKWEASKRGVSSGRAFWVRTVQHWTDTQLPDGGWMYLRPKEPSQGRSYGSMTCAGLTALLVAQQELHRHQTEADAQLGRAIDRGLAWMQQRFNGADNPGSGAWQWYYLYAVERVALASGWRQINGRDWFRSGSRDVLEAIDRGSGSAAGSIRNSLPDTCFALMFLARGYVPVWANKLIVPRQITNNRPNDLYFLTQHLSDLREGEVNWQAISADDPAEAWLSAPLTILASHGAVELSGDQKQRLKRYLDLGGMLLCLPERGSPQFARSVRELMKELYPHLAFEQAGKDHPVYRSLYAIEPEQQQAVHRLSNGVRDLVVLADHDWGIAWQSDGSDRRSTQPWQLGANLFAWVTDRGALPDRLALRYEARLTRRKEGQVSVGLVAMKQWPGGQVLEPAAWEQTANHLFNRTGTDIEVSSVVDGRPLMLESLDAFEGSLAHLASAEAVELTEAQGRAIERYLARGGTLLVEDLGGRGGFSKSIEVALTQRLRRVPAPLSTAEPVVSGEGMPAALTAQRVTLRRFTVVQGEMPPRLRLRAIHQGEDARPAVIFSSEDLTLGAMDVMHWGISGYARDTARQVMARIALYAARYQKLHETRASSAAQEGAE